jgi:hypothetical protein
MLDEQKVDSWSRIIAEAELRGGKQLSKAETIRRLKLIADTLAGYIVDSAPMQADKLVCTATEKRPLPDWLLECDRLAWQSERKHPGLFSAFERVLAQIAELED